MDPTYEKQLDEAEKIIGQSGLEVLPGSTVPQDADYHVCSNRPLVGVINSETICCKCGRSVFYSQRLPGVPKICVGCFIVLSKPTVPQTCVNEEAIRTAAELHDLNN